MTKITFDQYTWNGSLGCWFSSAERGVTVGTVRHVRGRLFSAWRIYRRWFRKDEIWWTPVEKLGLDHEHTSLAEFKKAL